MHGKAEIGRATCAQLQRTMATGAGLSGAITVLSYPGVAGIRSAAGGGQANPAAEKSDA